MNELNFCPKCGKKSLCWEQGKRWSCICGDEILLTKRNQEPAKGKLDLAGGFTDPNESAEFTCFRELKEELDIQIDTGKLRFLMSLPNIYHYKGIDYNTLDLFFEYRVEEKFSVNLEKSEIAETIWVKKENIQLEDIAFPSQRLFFERFLNKN